MQTIKTDHLNLHRLASNERTVVFPLGREIQLCSSLVRRPGYTTRSWYLQGSFGVIQFPQLEDDACLAACDELLSQNGYHKKGDLPPEVFEYTK